MIVQREGRAALGLVVAALLVGLAVGLLAGFVQTTPDRAEETLVLVRGSTPLEDVATARSLATTIRALADGHVVTSNVARALGLTDAEVRRDTAVFLDGSTLRVRAEASSSTQAVRLAQQYGIVLTALVRSRFAPLALSPFDPAHAAGRAPPPWGLNLLLGGLVGGLTGVVGAGLLLRRRGTPGRIVAAGPAPAPRQAADPPAAPEGVPDPVPDPRAAAPSETPPEPAPREPQLSEPAPVPPGAWSLAELRRRVDEARTRRPDMVAEWDTYLDLLAEHEVDGVLPASFGPLIDDVFGSILY